jgi:hypothetical protein
MSPDGPAGRARKERETSPLRSWHGFSRRRWGPLFLRLSTTERILGLVANDPEAPLSAVRAAQVIRPAQSAVRGIRAPGTGVPGLLSLGHWRGKGHDFVAVYGRHAGVVVELDGQPFERWIVSVDDPEAVVAEIEKGGVRRPSDSAS